MRISDWSSDVCSSDLGDAGRAGQLRAGAAGLAPARSPRVGAAEAATGHTTTIRAHRGFRRSYNCGPCRSEEHTSEHQSLMRSSYADFCLNNKQFTYNHTHSVLV